MGKIKKISEKELVGGIKDTDIYPVTSTKAVYDENNERLDVILSRIGSDVSGGSTGIGVGTTEFLLIRSDDVIDNNGVVIHGHGGLGEDWKSGYLFNLRIARYTDALLNEDNYRLVYMYTRRKRTSGISWSVPMFGNILGSYSSRPKEECWTNITGKNMYGVRIPYVPRIKYRPNPNNSRILQTETAKMKVGVAIFKKGPGIPGWWRCSNILGVEFYIPAHETSENPRSINTRYISE